MFDAETDCATEALDAFCAKKMREQLRNILSYPHMFYYSDMKRPI